MLPIPYENEVTKLGLHNEILLNKSLRLLDVFRNVIHLNIDLLITYSCVELIMSDTNDSRVVSASYSFKYHGGEIHIDQRLRGGRNG